jgi:hypothetical protein
MSSNPTPSNNQQNENTKSGIILSVVSALALLGGGAMMNVTYEKYAEWIPDWWVILLWTILACTWFYWGIKKYRHLIYTHPRMSFLAMIIVGGIIGSSFGGLIWWKVFREPEVAQIPTVQPESTEKPDFPVEQFTLTPESIASPFKNLPFGLRITVQSTVKVQPVHFRVICSDVIGQAQAGVAGASVHMGVMESIDKNTFEFSFESPAFTPQQPIIVKLFSAKRIECKEIIRLD